MFHGRHGRLEDMEDCLSKAASKQGGEKFANTPACCHNTLYTYAKD